MTDKKIITNCKIYDLGETLVASGYAMNEDYDIKTIENEQLELNPFDTDNKHVKRAYRLTKAPLNSGHPNFLSGILVSMDITLTNKLWVQWERYHFQQIVTSQSTMHKLSKMRFERVFNEHTDLYMVDRMAYLQDKYNAEPSKENYLKLIYSCPSGLKLTARVTTNYMQLMTIYKQRYNHKLPEWGEFCDELVEELPLFKEFLIANGCKVGGANE